MNATFGELRVGDVFKIVDHPQAGVYVVRGEDRIESVRHGHVCDFSNYTPDKPILITKRGDGERVHG